MMKRLVTLALTMVVTMVAWADDSVFGTEEVVCQEKTWTFNNYDDGQITSNRCDDQLYTRAYKDSKGTTNRTFTISPLDQSQELAIGGSSVTVSKVATGDEAGNVPGTLALKTANETGNSMKPFFAFNASVAGTCYMLVQKVNSGNSSSYRNRIYFGNGMDAISNVYSKDKQGSNDIEQISYTSTSAGVFVVGSTGGNCAVYAIRFVPSVYAPTFSQEGNIITITAGVCNISEATVITYYTTDGTDPATSETRASFTESSKEITISANTTIKAISISSTNVSGAVASEEFTYTAPAKTPIAPQISISNWTYGTTASTPDVSGTVGDGNQTIEYKERNADDNTYTTDVPTAIGQYTVRVSIAETENYFAGSATADFEIGRGVGSISYETTTVEKTTGEGAFKNPLTKVGDGTVSYASSNLEVATVDESSGEVTIVGAGTTTITATVTNGSNYDYAETTATYSLTVTTASVTKYAISLGDHDHGSLSVSPETAAEGETVTVTAYPDNGYQLSSITITKTDEPSTTYKKITDGTMTFTMPAYAVKVKVTYVKKTYTITYDLDGGNLVGEATNRETYDISTATFTLNNPTKDGHTFAGWTGTDLTEPTETVTITKGSTGDRSYTATWTENTPAVTTISDVTISGLTAPVKGGALTVLGSLSSSTTGVTISGITWSPTAETAAASTVYTATVTLTANDGYQFASTVTANAVAEKAAQLTRTDDTHVSVSYTFDETAAADPVGHTLNVNVDNASHGSVAITVNESAANSGDAVAEGASVSVIATANSGYTFKNWGNTELTANPYNFTMGTSDVNLTAIFEEEATGTEYTLTTVVNPEGKGTITYKIENESDNTTATSFDEGTHLVFSVSSIDSGYEFDKWQVNGEDATAESDGTLKVTMDANKSITAVLKQKIPAATKYKISLTIPEVQQSMGSVVVVGENDAETAFDADAEYEDGVSVKLKAKANDNYEFVKWTVGSEDISENPHTFTVSEGLSITATFKAKETPSAEKAVVILTAGQSNTAGRAENETLPEYIKTLGSGNENHYQYCNWSYTNSTNRLAESEGVFRPFWPERENNGAQFAYDAITYYWIEQALQKPFYVIKHAEGGTSIDPSCTSTNNHHWSADEAWLGENTSSNEGGLSMLKAFESNIGKSLDQLATDGVDYDIKCLLWHQGESDRSGTGPDNYYANLKAVVEHIRSYLVSKTGNSNYASLPFIAGTVPANSTQFNAKVRAALDQLATDVTEFYVIETNPGSFKSDHLHFDTNCAERLGINMYNKMIELGLINGEIQTPPEPIVDDSTTELDFMTWTNANGMGSNDYATLTLDETAISAADNQQVYKVLNSSWSGDFSEFAETFAIADNSSNIVRMRGGKGIFLNSGEQTVFSLLNLNPGDAVTFTFASGTSGATTLSFLSENVFPEGSSDLVSKGQAMVKDQTYIVKTGTQLDLTFGDGSASHSISCIKIEKGKVTDLLLAPSVAYKKNEDGKAIYTIKLNEGNTIHYQLGETGTEETVTEESVDISVDSATKLTTWATTESDQSSKASYDLMTTPIVESNGIFDFTGSTVLGSDRIPLTVDEKTVVTSVDGVNLYMPSLGVAATFAGKFAFQKPTTSSTIRKDQLHINTAEKTFYLAVLDVKTEQLLTVDFKGTGRIYLGEEQLISGTAHEITSSDLNADGHLILKFVVKDTSDSSIGSSQVQKISVTYNEVTVDLEESGSTATMTIENNEAKLTGVTLGETATTITISGAVGTNNVPVTSIAADAFNNITDKSAIKSVDFSATAITDVMVDRSSGVFSGFPEETMIYMPAGNTAATGQKNLIIDGSCSDFEMKDQSSYNIPKAFTATKATLSRSFTSEKYCTLCLPYDVPASSLGGKIYEFSSIEGTTVKMTEDTDGLNANKPYIFVPSAAAEKITASDVTVNMSDTPNTSPNGQSFTFKGVFGKKEFTAEEISGGVYGFAADSEHGASVGQFVKASNGAWTEGMRAYLAYSGNLSETGVATTRGEGLPEYLNVVLVSASGSTTNIGRLELMTAEDGSPVYNLNGQRVDKSYKGIIIQNGKKMIKK